MRPTRARARSQAAARWLRRRVLPSAANRPANRRAGALARRLWRRALSSAANHPIATNERTRAATWRLRRRGLSPATNAGVLQPAPHAKPAAAAGLTGCPCVLVRGISVTQRSMARHITGLPLPLAAATASARARPGDEQGLGRGAPAALSAIPPGRTACLGYRRQMQRRGGDY